VRYRAPPPEALLTVALDAFVAVFHRPSGATHLLTSPAPEILALLGDEPMAAGALLEALRARFDVPDGGDEALAARIAELVVAGLADAVA